MNLTPYLRQACSLPPHEAFRRAIRRVAWILRRDVQRRKDRQCETYSTSHPSSSAGLYRYFGSVPVSLLHPHAEQVSTLTEYYLAHRFDLLGLGSAQVKHGMPCGGVEGYHYEMGSPVDADAKGRWLEGRINPSNLTLSQHIWRLVDPNYIPIDWHLDFKSGYRWREDTWYLDIVHGHLPGVDIKVPWELARMQHLPQLAWAYALANQGQRGFLSPEVYAREFRNEVLDFIVNNPPRFGVNWRSAMDVSLRVVNWLVAFDLFQAYGAEFDHSFRDVFLGSLYSHGKHIIGHLEWSEVLRGNHYLSNVVGLLFVAAYLPRTVEVDAWLALAVQELVNEVEHQFHSDGTNFEASTHYHRLSAEMVVYGTAWVLGLPAEKQEALRNYDHGFHQGPPVLRPAPVASYPLPGTDLVIPFPPWYIERLEKMGEFTMGVTKPNGQVIQIGDNDSGRFLKFQPIYQRIKAREARAKYMNLRNDTDLPEEAVYWDEDQLDHRPLVAAVNGLFGRKEFTMFTGSGWIETDIVKHIAKSVQLPSVEDQSAVNGRKRESPRDVGPLREGVSEIGILLHGFPNFGLYVYRSDHLYWAIRCGSIGQNGNGGHAHNDNLSFVFNVKGRDFFVDGGSYLYTSLPSVRNAFRSTRAHTTLAMPGQEQNAWREGLTGLFTMRDQAKARVVSCGPKLFEGEHDGFETKHHRRFEWEGDSLVIEDLIETDSVSELNFNLAPGVEIGLAEKSGSDGFVVAMKSGEISLKLFLEGFSGVECKEGFFSPGYGKKMNNQRLIGYRSKPRTRVKIVPGWVVECVTE